MNTIPTLLKVVMLLRNIQSKLKETACTYSHIYFNVGFHGHHACSELINSKTPHRQAHTSQMREDCVRLGEKVSSLEVLKEPEGAEGI